MPKEPMRQIGNLNGVGQLIVDGDEFDGVGYSITVSIADGEKIQRGQITPPSAQALWDLSEVGGGVLRLEDGTEVDIVLLSTNVTQFVAEIQVNSALPGF